MSHDFFSSFFSRDIPSIVPAQSATAEDMARVTEADWAAIVDHAHRHCRKVDASRSRKRADGSATIARDGFGTYGSDDVSDDIAQDAVLIYARRLGTIIRNCAVASLNVTTREPDGWQYQTQDGETSVVNRAVIRRWAVHDAAQRNGYRPHRTTPDADNPDTARRQAEHLASVTYLAGLSNVIFAMAWEDGRDFPTLRQLLHLAGHAEDLGRAGLLATVAQQTYGGKYGSRRAVIKTRDAALAEARELTNRCDDIRRNLTHRDRPHREHHTDD
ncbi:hypothetical protein CcI6DRAFT_04955 [Frankia sp. CcI6]|uniref:hypothetical protein n=1 Tax=Frankia TaxID=1854 RepID=UPI0003D02576|nr:MULTISPECIES: hypothetical protein [Frankia]ESZ99637.1 hypothetical protein CcI6DRAFT_04955 [Frankia sp. CcI6]KFB03017.1 hypothetical protein ALLO2DRAFT_04192 [Frankia sp. Allo2]OAA20256.1 galactarate dehydratase [Frankia casuarinae]OFB43851.1 hypothetical protein Manayef4_10385 [Frankia sp. CgIM4]